MCLQLFWHWYEHWISLMLFFILSSTHMSPKICSMSATPHLFLHLSDCTAFIFLLKELVYWAADFMSNFDVISCACLVKMYLYLFFKQQPSILVPFLHSYATFSSLSQPLTSRWGNFHWKWCLSKVHKREVNMCRACSDPYWNGDNLFFYFNLFFFTVSLDFHDCFSPTSHLYWYCMNKKSLHFSCYGIEAMEQESLDSAVLSLFDLHWYLLTHLNTMQHTHVFIFQAWLNKSVESISSRCPNFFFSIQYSNIF